MEGFTASFKIPAKYPDEAVKGAKIRLKQELFDQASRELPANRWFAVRYRQQEIDRGPMDPLTPIEVTARLDVKEVQNEYVTMVSPAHIKYTKQKGFWKRLKLLFSRKPIYTAEEIK